ncbi:hypothetical protein TNCV_2206771 [Trichonephila clavipes]|uniref:Uncharacterized protein n=1 Tax=Trichonephila clavipes TaxID=2585209 RepID=A0A8X6S2H5_TRICX|nr:hypothetical protein TNCV_2206771 [Trichonephila clavipes]
MCYTNHKLPPSQYGGYDPRLITKRVRVRITRRDPSPPQLSQKHDLEERTVKPVAVEEATSVSSPKATIDGHAEKRNWLMDQPSA